MKKFILFSALLILAPGFSRAANDHLVINQVQVAGTTADDEFIEIFNPTDAPVAINGWSIQYKSSTGSFPLSSKKNLPDASIPAHGYFLIANSGYAGTVAPDLSHSSFKLSGEPAGATIFLTNVNTPLGSGEDPAIVDKLAYGTSPLNIPEVAAAPVPPESQALARNNGLDTDDNSADFSIQASGPHNLAASPADPNPPNPQDEGNNQEPPQDNPPAQDPPTSGGGGGSPAYSSSVIISEFLPNPDGADSGEEWIELYNPSDSAVDLASWIFDDESRDGNIGSSAYTLPSGTVISAKNYLALDLPEGSFALDNTGGDVLRLLWPDKKILQSVSYTGNASEDTAYARKTDGTYAWTKLATKGSANDFESEAVENGDAQIASTYTDFRIFINEIYPNPAGSDSGNEWIELANLGPAAVTIHGWILDDGEPSAPVGSSAYRIESPTIQPGGVAVVAIPAGKFALNNTGKETVRLFSPDKTLADAVAYEGAKEGESYAKADGKWFWGLPTPNQANQESNDVLSVVINEVFPYPSKGSEEFIEILNLSDKEINLSGWKIKSQKGSFRFGQEILPASGLLALKRSETGIALANSAKEKLELVSDSGQVVSALEYEDAPKNRSLARTAAGEYEWTGLVTAGEENKFGTEGKVSGATLVRTGNPVPSQDPTLFYFAVFAVIWYIAYKFVGSESTNLSE